MLSCYFLLANQNVQDNPYQEWINTYAGEEFGIAVQQAISICDSVASSTTEQTRVAMTEAFITASQLRI